MINISTDLSIVILPSPIPEILANVLSHFKFIKFANRFVIKLSWDAESSIARQGAKIPKLFLTITTAVARKTVVVDADVVFACTSLDEISTV